MSRQCGALGPYTTLTTTTPQADPIIHSVFEPQTSTYQYIVADPATNTVVIIDPVLDYNNATRTITTTAVEALLALIHKHNYTVSRIGQVQSLFGKRYGIVSDEYDGVFATLFGDDDGV